LSHFPLPLATFAEIEIVSISDVGVAADAWLPSMM
jgi:hypothetical protein